MEKLRAAIMGCGRISACYEDAFRRLSDYVELVCAIDIDKDKAKAFGEKFKIGMHNQVFKWQLVWYILSVLQSLSLVLFSKSCTGLVQVSCLLQV